MIIYRTSYNKIKTWLYIPFGLLDIVFSKLFNLIPHLTFKYNVLAAIIDTDKSLPQETKTKEEWVELKIMDITNKKLRYSLYLSGIFKKWYIYKTRNIGVRDYNRSDNNRDVIYISKDKINITEGVYYGERLSDYNLNEFYTDKKLIKYLKKINLKYDEFYKIEPQMYAIAALRTELHEFQRKERKIIYKKKMDHALDIKVKEMIKKEDLFKFGYVYGNNSDIPIFHKVVDADRIDLVQKILNSAEDDEEREALVNFEASREYGYSRKPLNFAKSDDMKKLLNKWMDLEKYDRYRKIMKIKKGIK